MTVRNAIAVAWIAFAAVGCASREGGGQAPDTPRLGLLLQVPFDMCVTIPPGPKDPLEVGADRCRVWWAGSMDNTKTCITDDHPLASVTGGYLHVAADRGGGDWGGVACLPPLPAPTAPPPDPSTFAFGSWFSASGTAGQRTINGSIDFLMRLNCDTGAVGDLSFLLWSVFNVKKSLRYEVKLQVGPVAKPTVASLSATLRDTLTTGDSSRGGFESMPGVRTTDIVTRSAPSIEAGKVYHVAMTFETTRDGIVETKLYVREVPRGSDGTIRSSDIADSGAYFDIRESVLADIGGLAAGRFTFGLRPSKIDRAISVDFDSLRIWDNVPETFPGVGTRSE